jgi:hypothetical protein
MLLSKSAKNVTDTATQIAGKAKLWEVWPPRWNGCAGLTAGRLRSINVEKSCVYTIQPATSSACLTDRIWM